MFYFKRYDSPIGEVMIASDENNIVGLWFVGQKYFAASVNGEMTKNDDLEILVNAEHWLDKYFAGKAPDISELPLAPAGSEFRLHVWEILMQIPYGQVTTYAKIAKETAKRMGRKSMSSQAVGGAVGRNPISIIIPCHRVIGTNGSLTGYAGGIDKKIELLKLEGVNLENMFIPKK